MLILLFGLLHLGAFFLDYGFTPMGRFPVLDGLEMLNLAESIGQGRLAEEPFYRAPLYPALLAMGVKLGINGEGLAWWARLLNAMAWLGSTWLVARLAQALWRGNQSAGLLAAGLWVAYPVTIWFAGDPLDVTVGTFLFLAALERTVSWWRRGGEGRALSAGLFIALAALTRPHFWTVALLLPLVVAGAAWWRAKAHGAREVSNATEQPEMQTSRVGLQMALAFAAVVLGVAGPALSMGGINYRLGGEFRVLPSQGSYDLWAANRPGAHGKYFVQQVRIVDLARHENPTRLEAETLYRREAGPEAPAAGQSAHWRGQFLEHASAEPFALLGHFARKFYYLFHQTEQYNNKTFAVHRELSPVLRWNPLGWGLLMILAVGSLILGRADRGVLGGLLLAFAVFAGGVLLYYVSARFRLPLVPLLAIFAGGWATVSWSAWRRWRTFLAAGAMLFAAGCAWSDFHDVNQPPTALQDYLLLGYAALEAANDREAQHWSEQALTEDPGNWAARELRVVATFNMGLESLPTRPEEDELEDRLRNAAEVAAESSRAAFVAGVYAWWGGEHERARFFWHQAATKETPAATDARMALNFTDPKERRWMPAAQIDRMSRLLGE